MRVIFLLLGLGVLFKISPLEAKESDGDGDVKIIYKYKKYEKFDFEDMRIEGEVGTPGDLSIRPRFQKRYKNRLPYRKNFNAEIKKAVERIK